jgi:K(+)-stimulated pyrophosphate-energized sodium pump
MNAFILISAGLAIVVGIILAKRILSLPSGNEKMREIASAIQEGAKAYLNRQYRTIALVAVILFIVIGVIPSLGWTMAIAFLVGAILSALTGYIGMNVSVRANVRTAEAAKGGLKKAMGVAVQGGAVTGLLVVGLALLGTAGVYFMGVLSFPSSHVLAVESLPKLLTLELTLLERLNQAYQKTIRETQQLLLIMWVTMWVTVQEWLLTFLKHTR